MSPSYRVEVVDTAEHWPAAYFPDAGIPIVRGWYRQSDFPQNELLYDSTARPARLRRLAATHGRALRRALRCTGRLQLAKRGGSSCAPADAGSCSSSDFRHLSVYEVPHATPLITGPAAATVVWLWPQRLVAQLDAPGSYRLRMRWSPYWRHVDRLRLRSRQDGMTQLTTHETGLIQLSFGVGVTRDVSKTLAGDSPTQVLRRGRVATIAAHDSKTGSHSRNSS